MQLANQLNTPTRDLPGQSIRKRPVPDALDILEQFACTIKIGRTHEIYRHDDPTEFCWKILSGCVRKVRALEDGRRQIREFRWPGDLIGLDDLERTIAMPKL